MSDDVISLTGLFMASYGTINQIYAITACVNMELEVRDMVIIVIFSNEI